MFSQRYMQKLGGRTVTGFTLGAVDQTLDLSPQTTDSGAIRGMFMDDSGTRLYQSFIKSPFYFLEYSLSTPYNLNTATYVGNISTNFGNSSTRSVWNGLIVNNGNRMIVSDGSQRTLSQYDTTTPYDWTTRTVNYFFTGLPFSTTGYFLKLSIDGNKLYFNRPAVNVVRVYDLGTANDITSITGFTDISLNSFSFWFLLDGNYILNQYLGDFIELRKLTIPYDLSSAEAPIQQSQFETQTQITNIWMNVERDRMFYTIFQNLTIYSRPITLIF